MISQISRDEVRSAIEDKLCANFSVTGASATDEQIFQATAIVIREIMSRLLAVEASERKGREVHYMSMEFLMGRSLMKNAYNLGIAEAVQGALSDLGHNATDIFEEEPDAGLGNGGLGRLAACYMDSLATLGMQATGYSICYELGIFRQKFENGGQHEVADNWRSAAESWLIPRHEDEVEVRFGGQISPHWDNFGHYTAEYSGYTSVIALPRDMLIAGYGGKEINTLRLWEAKSPNSLDMYLFYFFRKAHEDLYINYWDRIAYSLGTTSFWLGVAIIPLCWLLLHAITGAYQKVYQKSRLKELEQTFFVTLLGVVVIFFVVILDDEVTTYKSYYQSFITLFHITRALSLPSTPFIPIVCSRLALYE